MVTRFLRGTTTVASGIVMLAVMGFVAGCATQGGSSGLTHATVGSDVRSSATRDDTTRVGSWRMLSTSADGMTLTIGVTVGGGCERIDRVDVTESQTTITITPIILMGLADACADSLATVEQSVFLHDPVGERALVHGEGDR